MHALWHTVHTGVVHALHTWVHTGNTPVEYTDTRHTRHATRHASTRHAARHTPAKKHVKNVLKLVARASLPRMRHATHTPGSKLRLHLILLT